MKKLCVELWNSIGQMENGKDIKNLQLHIIEQKTKRVMEHLSFSPGEDIPYLQIMKEGVMRSF